MVGGSTLHAAVAFHLGPNKVAPIVRSATKQEQLPSRSDAAGDSTLRPEIRQDHPLNLSISISGGKETNQDSPSNGE
jgi:hypothetical protein